MSISQRLYPTPAQELILKRHCADSRFVYNLGLEQRNMYRKNLGPTPNFSEQSRQLTEARDEFEWFSEGSFMIQSQALRDLDQAFQNWWKNPAHFGRPTWRKAGENESFRVVRLKALRLNRKWGEVRVPKIGYVRFRLTRAWCDIDTSRSARVTLNRSGQWHVTFIGIPPSIKRESTGSVVGIDMGIAHTVTDSNGNHAEIPALLSPGEAQRKVRLQRKLSRQVKGSNRYERTRISRAKITQREASRRKDWIEKTTTELVVEHDMLAIENLRIENMVRSAKGTIEKPGTNVKAKSGLNRTIHAQGWGTFRVRLIDKAARADAPVSVIAVPAKNTSRCCSVCGHTAKENRKNQATFRCQVCKHTEHADVNAAKNILAAGLAVSGRGGTPELVGPVKRQLEVGALV